LDIELKSIAANYCAGWQHKTSKHHIKNPIKSQTHLAHLATQHILVIYILPVAGGTSSCIIKESTIDDFVVIADTGLLICDLPTVSTLLIESVFVSFKGVLGRADSGRLG